MGAASLSSTALVLVDVQQWITELPLHPRVDTVVQNCQALRSAVSAAGGPVFHVRYLERSGARADADAPPNRIVSALTPSEGEVVITKYGIDAFAGTELLSRLRASGAERVVVAGIATAHAVLATARTASEHGYLVTVASDATASLSAREHLAALDELRTVVTVEPCAAQAVG